MAQTWAGFTDAQRVSYEMALLERAYPEMPMLVGNELQSASIARREGLTREWRIYGGATVATTGAGLALATTPLTEGQPPSASLLTVAKVTATVAQYGAYIKLSDLLVHQGIDPVWVEGAELLGEQCGQTLHTLAINVLAGGTNVIYASSATTRGTVGAAMIITSDELREVKRALRRAKVRTFGDRFYHALIHPDTEMDLSDDADFKDMMKNGAGRSAEGGNSMISGTIGDFLGFRFMVSTDAPSFGNVGASSAPVFGSLFYGPGWGGKVDLAAQPMPNVPADGRKAGIKIMGVPVDVEAKDDPLAQYGVEGWKTTAVFKILRQWCGVRLEHSATV